MSTDLEDALRTVMRSHTADVVSPPALVATVLRGGARRRLHSRLAVGATPLLVIAAVLGGVLLLAPGSGTGTTQVLAMTAADEALLVRPTGGDLASDSGYLNAVGRAWQRSHRDSENADRGIFDRMIGQPHVVWAGHTSVGPAAIVVQAADLRHHDDIQLDHEGPALLTGFVGTGSGDAPLVVADTYPAPGAPRMEAAFIGADRRVLLVVDRGRPVRVSFGRTYADDGYVTRQWSPVTFADGVALLARPDGTDPRLTALRSGGPDGIWIGNVLTPAEQHAADVSPIDPRLPWLGPGGRGWGTWQVGPAPTAGWGGPVTADNLATVFEQALERRIPGYPETNIVRNSNWYVWGTTADGSRLVVGEKELDPDPSRVYAVLRTPAGRTEVATRPVDAHGPLPVAVPLPRGQGWLVAQVGAELSYRTAVGVGWQAAGRDAALLPAAAVIVRVVRSDHTDEVLLHR
jgi:hypothetical protein